MEANKIKVVLELLQGLIKSKAIIVDTECRFLDVQSVRVGEDSDGTPKKFILEV